MLKENYLFNILNNIVETGFQLNHQPSEVLDAKDSKIVTTVFSAL